MLLSYLGNDAESMQVDATAPTAKKSATPAPAAASRPGTPATAAGKKAASANEAFIPEIDIYLTLLVIVYLLDQKQTDKVGDPRPDTSRADGQRRA